MIDSHQLHTLDDETLLTVVGGTVDPELGCGGFGDGTPYPTEPPTSDDTPG